MGSYEGQIYAVDSLVRETDLKLDQLPLLEGPNGDPDRPVEKQDPIDSKSQGKAGSQVGVVLHPSLNLTSKYARSD